MKRSEMDPRFQWDFTHIYPDKAHWEAAMTEAEKAVESLSALPGTLGQSKDALKKGLEQLADASQKAISMPCCTGRQTAQSPPIRRWKPGA